MSLVLGVVQKDFVMVSCDSKVTMQYYNAETLEKMGEIEETNLVKPNKVLHLTDKVLLVTTGWSSCGDLLKNKMKYRVDPEWDLQKCSEVAKEVLHELKNGLTPLTEEEKETVRLFDSKGFSGYLVGFNHSGMSGLTDLINFNYMETPSDERKGYPTLINSPKPEHDFQFRKMLALPREERTFSKFQERIMFAHAYLSKIHHQSVSTDCNFFILVKQENDYVFKEYTFDTLPLYPFLELEPN